MANWFWDHSKDLSPVCTSALEREFVVLRGRNNGLSLFLMSNGSLAILHAAVSRDQRLSYPYSHKTARTLASLTSIARNWQPLMILTNCIWRGSVRCWRHLTCSSNSARSINVRKRSEKWREKSGKMMRKSPFSTFFCYKSVGFSQELITFAPDLQTEDE